MHSVTVVVLSFNRPHLIGAAIESILTQTVAVEEIIVVDNFSSSSVNISNVLSRYPRVTLISNKENLGFSGGMNLGISKAAGEYIYITEDDIELNPDCLEILSFQLDQLGGNSLLSPILLDSTTGETRYAGGSINQSTMSLTLWTDAPSPLFETDFIGGASIFGKRALLTSLRGFRDDFFLYWEDVELSVRTSRLGIKKYIAATAKAIHITPGVTMSNFVLYHYRKNHVALVMLHGASLVYFKGLLSLAKEIVSRFLKLDFGGSLAIARALAWNLFHLPRLLFDRNQKTALLGPAIITSLGYLISIIWGDGVKVV